MKRNVMLYPGRDDWKKNPEIRAAFRVIAEAGDVAALTGKDFWPG